MEASQDTLDGTGRMFILGSYYCTDNLSESAAVFTGCHECDLCSPGSPLVFRAEKAEKVRWL